MNNDANKQKILYVVLGVIFGVIAISVAVYLWIVLGNRGAYADATHTGGYTTVPEMAMMILTVVLIFTSLACFLKAAFGTKKK